MKKKLKKILKAMNKTLQTINKFLQQTLNNYKCMKKKIKSYWLMLFVILCLTSCGSTKVTVDRPASGTSTTIKVTTNNPITTDVNPNLELKNTK